MLAIVQSATTDVRQLEKQVEQLRQVPRVERVMLATESGAVAARLGLERVTPAKAKSFDQLARLSNGRPILKVNDSEVMAGATLRRLIESHEKDPRPVTALCAGPNDFNYFPVALAEIFDPGRATRRGLTDRVSAELRTQVHRRAKQQYRALRRRIGFQNYRKMRELYFRYFMGLKSQIDHDVSLPPSVEISDMSFPREEINVFTGNDEDKLNYAVGRIHDFFPFPSDIHYILTNLCNLRCVMCPYHSETARSHRRSNFFDRAIYAQVDHFRRVAEEAGRHGCAIRLGQLEEVLIHPKLVDMVEIARNMNVPEVHVTTNGTLLTPEKSEQLLDAGLTSLMVSIDACTAHTYDEIRIRGDFGKVVRHTQEFIRLRNRRRSSALTSVSMILQGPAVAEKDDFVKFWREEGVDQVTVYQLSDYNSEGNIIRHDAYYNPQLGRYACAAPWMETFIYPGGDVSLCCYTLELVPTKGILSVGNVQQEPLSNIWTGSSYQQVRQQLVRNQFEDDITRQSCGNGCQIWTQSTYYQRDLGSGVRMNFNETMATYHFS